MIGKGSMSNVFLVKSKQGEPYAMKSILKEMVLSENVIDSTRLEQDILLKVEHPFFVNNYYVFTTDTRIIYIMNFVRGGDLFMHLMQLGTFTEEMMKFFIC